jgi:HAD superfamily hydrolase (TIGR01509 family)
MLSALIFDVDGTLADTESVHRAAFNAAFAECGLDWHWDQPLYTGLLEVAGGMERLRHYRSGIDPAAAQDVGDARLAAIHAAKTRHYTSMASQVRLRPGVLHLIREAHGAGLPMAIATTTTPANVDALLRPRLGENWRDLFVAVCDAASCHLKKPAPDVYLAALGALALPASRCLAFEDSRNGLLAAHAAGIPTLITPTAYTAAQRFDEALLVLPHLGLGLAALRRLHRAALFESA